MSDLQYDCYKFYDSVYVYASQNHWYIMYAYLNFRTAKLLPTEAPKMEDVEG